MKKKRKIKWGNVLSLVGLLATGGIVIKDLYLVAFKGACFTWFGIYTGLIIIGVFTMCLEHIEEEWRKLDDK